MCCERTNLQAAALRPLRAGLNKFETSLYSSEFILACGCVAEFKKCFPVIFSLITVA